MSINLISGGRVPTAWLVADYGQAAGGSSDSVPTLTMVNNKPVSAALEVQSILGGILFPRMTTTQRNALTVVNGMSTYNSTTNTLDLFASGAWFSIATTVSAAPSNATYILKTANALLPNAESLGTLTTGLMKNTVSLSVGTLSTAIAGTDYYSPGNPTTIIDTTAAVTDNLFVGSLSGNLTLSGTNNSGFGVNVLTAVTSGGNNTASGFQAGVSLTLGSNNALFGCQAGSSITGSPANAFFGYQSGHVANSGGGGNCGFGYQSLVLSTAAVDTTAIGISAGALQLTYTNCTFVGADADASVNNLTNATAIGWNSSVSASNCLVLGNGANVGIGISAPTSTLHVIGSSTITTTAQFPGQLLNTSATYSTGTASQSGSTITGSGTTFVGDMVGGVIVYADGNSDFIVGDAGPTTLQGASNQTVGSQAFTIYYNGFASAKGWAGVNNLAIGTNGSIRGLSRFTTGIASTDSTYSTGLASQTGTVITGSGGATFTPDMVGGVIVYTDLNVDEGGAGLIVGFTNSTTLVSDNSTSTSGAVIYTIYYNGLATYVGSGGVGSVGISNLYLGGAGVAIAAYRPAVLNYYEEITLNGQWAGPVTVTNKNVYLTRIGRIVTMRTDMVSGSSGSASSWVFSLTIPVRFLPADSGTAGDDLQLTYAALSGGARAVSVMFINVHTVTVGTITAFYGLTNSNFSNTGTVTMFQAFASWNV